MHPQLWTILHSNLCDCEQPFDMPKPVGFHLYNEGALRGLCV